MLVLTEKVRKSSENSEPAAGALTVASNLSACSECIDVLPAGLSAAT